MPGSAGPAASAPAPYSSRTTSGLAPGPRETDGADRALPLPGHRYRVEPPDPTKSVLQDPFVLGLLRTLGMVKEEAAELAFENERLTRRLRQIERRQSSASVRGGEAAVEGSLISTPQNGGMPRRVNTVSSAPQPRRKGESSDGPTPRSAGTFRRSRTVRVDSKRLSRQSVRQIVGATAPMDPDADIILEVKF
mmetsp:Transcript_3177/g.7704  ORF Transcript_3177/g.7704 Transcript_3177/m.7704 type:complete len:193 (-) Transcript_3177:84-662(-)|eukprot:CAMPEP_0182933616 /NCGR_PEP_ID=MMETSP0105_2-20130417/34296_1 /TAXON_ID=81532 ORGANISM="Acanthoeca-like sp., Strain 10tr" /NCGR_SAMPLE_ID=MMETSP0105_2 /ASSEMBLY_ACC=CAM_ASM_000205 /LENGTH=192 /DNA_ID=CAMNT_0025072377 /DNA_START=139 /DNA_END=717 /DNA_ORIENTATION=+